MNEKSTEDSRGSNPGDCSAEGTSRSVYVEKSPLASTVTTATSGWDGTVVTPVTRMPWMRVPPSTARLSAASGAAAGTPPG